MTAKALTFKGLTLLATIFSLFCFSSCDLASLADNDEDGGEIQGQTIKDSKPAITEGDNWICLSYAMSGMQQEYKATYSGDKLASYIQTYTYESRELRDLIWKKTYSEYSYASKIGERSINIDCTDEYADYSFEQMRIYLKSIQKTLDSLFE